MCHQYHLLSTSVVNVFSLVSKAIPLPPPSPSHKNPKLFRGVCSSFAEGGVSAVKIVNLIWCSEIVKIVNLVCTQNPDESAHSRRDLHFRLYFTLITLTYGG